MDTVLTTDAIKSSMQAANGARARRNRYTSTAAADGCTVLSIPDSSATNARASSASALRARHPEQPAHLV